jgi:2-polyprenyl-3-methyl-5-hydroxy-6-metoxy-1,4-benzoquinol methylase
MSISAPSAAGPAHGLSNAAGQPMWQVASPDQMRRAGELVTGKFAQRLIDLSGISTANPADIKVLDNACGSGIVTARLLDGLGEKGKGLKVVCGDLQQGMVDYVQERAQEQGWAGVEVQVVDAQVSLSAFSPLPTS